LEREACLAAEASGEGRLLRDHLDDQPDEKHSIFLDLNTVPGCLPDQIA
jgi:hypothetical protein